MKSYHRPLESSFFCVLCTTAKLCFRPFDEKTKITSFRESYRFGPENASPSFEVFRDPAGRVELYQRFLMRSPMAPPRLRIFSGSMVLLQAGSLSTLGLKIRSMKSILSSYFRAVRNKLKKKKDRDLSNIIYARYYRFLALVGAFQSRTTVSIIKKKKRISIIIIVRPLTSFPRSSSKHCCSVTWLSL